MDKYVRHSLTK